MNWLAHLLLSGPSPAARIGGLLPDFAPRSELDRLPAEFQDGIQLHYRIDAFTDSHAVVKRSVQRFRPPLRRFGGVLVDVFYDHFLSRSWNDFSEQPLEDFVRSVYASFGTYRRHLPQSVADRFDQMRKANWLCSYGEIDGVRLCLSRISSRLRHPIDLSPGAEALESDYEQFRLDFDSFFPELLTFVRSGTPLQQPTSSGNSDRLSLR